VDGILIIDKPAGITSHDVVSRVRRILKTRRVGHTGTLDPFATGVMVVLVGKATRLAQFLDKDEKEYLATVRFGFETDTGDRTGKEKVKGKRQNAEFLDVDWDSLLSDFRGEIEQVPPMYSAKKIAGKKLYEHARKGETIERRSVAVTISKLEITRPIKPENLEHGTWNMELRIVCSAGTYIRTLAEDIGRAVGVGAHLAELRRTRAGRFGLAQSVTLEELAEMTEPWFRLLPVQETVSHLEAVELNAERTQRTKTGLATRVTLTDLSDGQAVRMIADTGELIAVGIYDAEENSIRPKVVLV
jgi:tRNA pseudouridine55 synthase